MILLFHLGFSSIQIKTDTFFLVLWYHVKTPVSYTAQEMKESLMESSSFGAV